MKREKGYYTFTKLSVHRKPCVELVKHCVKLQSIGRIEQALTALIYRSKGKSLNGKYHSGAAKLLLSCIYYAHRSYTASTNIKDVTLEAAWVTKGESRGVGYMPRARGRSTPRYHPSTNIYIKFANIKDEVPPVA